MNIGVEDDPARDDALCARKKSSQKSTRPRGAKDVETFPGAIGRNNACVRADTQQVALGGRKQLPRVGECIVADGWRPCHANRCGVLPSLAGGLNPSTWFVGLRSDGFNRPKRVSLSSPSHCVSDLIDHGDLPRGPLFVSPSSWCGKIREACHKGQGRFFSVLRNCESMVSGFQFLSVHISEMPRDTTHAMPHQYVQGCGVPLRQPAQAAHITLAMTATTVRPSHCFGPSASGLRTITVNFARHAYVSEINEGNLTKCRQLKVPYPSSTAKLLPNASRIAPGAKRRRSRCSKSQVALPCK